MAVNRPSKPPLSLANASKRQPPAGANQKSVRAALKKIRDFHAQGKESLEEMPDRADYGSMLAEEENGHSADAIRKARHFARSYSDLQIDDLLERCAKQNFPLGKTHVIQLLSLDTRRGWRGPPRRMIENVMIGGHWSRRRLEQEIKKYARGPEHDRGRRIQTLQDEHDAVTRLLKHGGFWNRLIDAILASNESTLTLPAAMRDKLVENRNATKRLLGDASDWVKTHRKSNLRNFSSDRSVRIRKHSEQTRMVRN